MGEKRTSEVAAMLGISSDLIRKWKKRGYLTLAPQGVSGQGRAVECFWSDEAIQQIRDRIAAQPSTGTRYTRPAKENEGHG